MCAGVRNCGGPRIDTVAVRIKPSALPGGRGDVTRIVRFPRMTKDPRQRRTAEITSEARLVDRCEERGVRNAMIWGALAAEIEARLVSVHHRGHTRVRQQADDPGLFRSSRLRAEFGVTQKKWAQPRVAAPSFSASVKTTVQ